MKKFLALALILTLALSVSVFAAETTTHVVGNHGATGKYDDGLALGDGTGNTWNGSTTDSSTKVDIIVTTNAYESRYAVDIEYNPITFNVAASNMVWDVNKLQYVPVEGQNALTQPADQPITVKNYSDQPVTVTSNVVMDPTYVNCPMHINATSSVPVEKAKAATATAPGEAATGTVTISVTADNNEWDKVATYFAPFFEAEGTTSLVVATVQLTISKVTP